MTAGLFEVADDITVTGTVVSRACGAAALEIPGLVSLQPGVSTIAAGLVRRAAEILAGREASDPVDGVSLSIDDRTAPQVHLTVAVAGRSAREVAAELLDVLPARVQELAGVRPAGVTVRISDIVPVAPDRAGSVR